MMENLTEDLYNAALRVIEEVSINVICVTLSNTSSTVLENIMIVNMTLNVRSKKWEEWQRL